MTLDIIKCEGDRPLAPRESVFTESFWKSLAKGEFNTTRCDDCSELMFPPRPHCPSCWSKNVNWVTLSGIGKLYARTTIHAGPVTFNDITPYTVGIIDLQEGIRLVASILEDTKTISNNDDVQLVILSYEDGPLFAVRGITEEKF